MMCTVKLFRIEKNGERATCSELDGVPNIRLFLPGEVYALGIAAALDVGDAIVTPAVLVVADQEPVVISRQSRLSSTCCCCCERNKIQIKIPNFFHSSVFPVQVL